MIEFTTDYRARNSPELMKHKLALRKIMDESSEQTVMGDLKKYLLQNYPTVKFRDIESHYKPNDLILASTNNEVEAYEHLHPIQPLYQMKRASDGFQLKEILTQTQYETLSDKSTAEARQCFTIHAFQGKTLNEGTLFIDMTSYIWEPAMYYTAISRCIQNSQICLIV